MNFNVDRERLRRHLQIIVGERSPFGDRRHLSAVEHFVERQFESYGLDVERDFFPTWAKAFTILLPAWAGRETVRRSLLERTLIRSSVRQAPTITPVVWWSYSR